MPEAARLRQLGAFLRAYRAMLKPADVGLPETVRRRTPGLRREEVAARAGVGVTWYTWLEQGRVQPSRRVLDALASTLMLDSDAHRHLLSLAGLEAPDRSPSDTDTLVMLQPVLDGWPTSPALLLDRHLDILAWNEAYTATWSSPQLIPRPRRNLMWLMVADPTTYQALPDWEPLARSVLWQLRTQADLYPEDERFTHLYAVLREERPDLGHWWACRGVRTFTTRAVTVRRRGEGDLQLLYSALRPADDPEGMILLQTPVRAIDHQHVSRRMAARPSSGRVG